VKHTLNESILRLYDIRGEFGKTLNNKDAFFIGKAFASIVRNDGGLRIAVARDGRLSSPELTDSLVQGLVSCGTDVYLTGLVPTPALYFAVHDLNLDAGVMVTGSHNPKEHNGFKLLLSDKPFYGEDIKKLAKIVYDQRYLDSPKVGQIFDVDILDNYLNAVFSKINFAHPINIVWDCGNGAAGAVIKRLSARVPGHHALINEQIDGNFPGRSPDPTAKGSMDQIHQLIMEGSYDLGIAFDGDADRLVVLDNKGRIISGDQLLCLMARDVLEKHPGAKIIADIKSSLVFFDEVKRLGGVPVMSSTGHSLIKAKMRETGALLAGELSGHLFFSDDWYGFDDALYSSVRLASFLTNQNKSLSDLLDDLPKTFSSPEIRISCSRDRAFEILETLSRELALEPSLEIKTIDGLRVKSEYGWWLLRASNTQDVMVARAEAKTQENFVKIEQQLYSILKRFGLQYRRG
jgi:phosphomannomutase